MTTFTVDTNATSSTDSYTGGNLSIESDDGFGLSFHEALGLAQDGDIITFDAGLSGTSITDAVTYFIDRDITINGDIDGDGRPDITLNADGLSTTLFNINGVTRLTLNGLTITGVDGGTAIHASNGATLTVRESIITGNTADGWGSIDADGATVTLDDVRVENNTTAGAVVNIRNSTVSITDTSITGNTGDGVLLNNNTVTAFDGVTIASNSGNGIRVEDMTVTISNSVLTGNGSAELQVGTDADVTVENSILAGANPSVAFSGTGQTLTFSGSNVLDDLAVAYSGNAPTIETDLAEVFNGITGDGGTLTLHTLPSGAQVYVGLANPTGVASGLGVAFAPTIGGDRADTIDENSASVSGTLTISDLNGAAEESFDVDTIAGSYGDLAIAANGDWVYTLDTTDAAVDSMDPGDHLTDTITVTSADGTTQDITITINGAEDAAVVSGDLSGVIARGDSSTSGSLAISDVDADDNPSFADVGSTAGDNGHGQFVLTAGTWSYTAGADALADAADGTTLTDTHSFTATDGTIQVITVTIDGTGSPPTAPSLRSDGVLENVEGAYIGLLSASDPDGGQVSFSVRDARFRIEGDKLYLKDGVFLDFESADSVIVRVYARDADGVSSSAIVSFDVLDTDVGLTLAGTAAANTLTGSEEGDKVWARGGGDHVYGMNGDDQLGGSTGNDTLEGMDGNDRLYGGTGDDSVLGGAGDDILYNGTGNDVADGGEGDDMLWAGPGNDSLTGGAGADTFVFGVYSGNDIIADFDIHADILDLAARGFADRAAVEAAASNSIGAGTSGVLIDLGGGESVFIAGLTVASLASVDMVF